MTSAIADGFTVEFDPPILTPAPSGLFAAITQGGAWTDSGDGPNRVSIAGVRVRAVNYGGDTSTGVWDVPWCDTPGPGDEKGKGAARPDFPDPFGPVMVWGWDACDHTALSRAEVERNAELWLKLRASKEVEKAFGTRLLADAGTPLVTTSFLDALGQLEVEIAETGLPGFIHASPYLAPFAADAQAIHYENGKLPKTCMGTTWIFGGGYAASLGKKMVATSQPFGWRDAPAITTGAVEPSGGVPYVNQFVAVAEQTFAIGYEKLIAVAAV